MPSYRLGRTNEDIQRELSVLLRTVKDPRVSAHMLSIVRVDTASDLGSCKIYISCLDKGDEKEIRRGLRSASGYLRKELSRALNLQTYCQHLSAAPSFPLFLQEKFSSLV